MATDSYESFLLNLRRRRDRGEATVERMRNDADRFARSVADADDITVTALDDPELRGIQLDPQHLTSTDVILHFHGGGFVSGSPIQHLALLNPLARACRARIVAPTYRLAPEHRYPTAHRDAAAAYRHLLDLDVEPSSIIVSGDSAGADLAISTVLAANRQGLPLPRRLILLCPWIDPTLTSASMSDLDAHDPIASPEIIRLARDSYFPDPAATANGVSDDDLSGLPPIVIHTAGLDPFRDEGAALVRQARSAGVNVVHDHWTEMVHVWHLYTHLFPEAAAAVEGVARFLNEPPHNADLCNGAAT